MPGRTACDTRKDEVRLVVMVPFQSARLSSARLAGVYAGIVYKDVDATEGLLDRADKLLHIGFT